jgi:hypothetical protein
MALTAPKISEIFGQRLHRKMSGKLATVIDQIEHGHHVYRTYFKHAVLKQYEKFSTLLRTSSAPTTSRTRGSGRAWTISKARVGRFG